MVRAIDFLGRLTRTHALLLTCTCALLLLVNFSPSTAFLPALTWSNDANSNENEIDSALQQSAEVALGNRQGSIIVMDAQTGRVRAAVNPEGAYAHAMMPGSSIKPFTTLAALRAGLIEEDSRTVCPGRFTGLSFSLPCVHANHLPPFNPSQAIAHSCNYYFATLGQRLGPDKLTQTLRQFGFGQPSGLNSREANGVVKPCAAGDVARMRSNDSHHASQQADCAAREALGESDHIQVTPIQLLTAYAALLNDGHLFQPQAANADGLQLVERSRINISPEERRVVVEGMAGAIRYGTARSARLDVVPLTIVGKTGTALPPKGFRLNGWFVGLAGPASASRDLPPSQVQLAVIVFLPRANGAEAAKVSRPIFQTFANQIGDRGTESSGSSPSDVSQSRRRPASSSAVRVRSVTENVTRDLPLENYVLGVMRAEGSMESEPEALKALAIAARTYALKNLGRHAKDDYDFCSTTHCQRFIHGNPTDDRASDRLVAAVAATEGQVLLDSRGSTIDAYFGASCGGETADVATLWGTAPATYLPGVRDEFCETGPHAHWTDMITRNDLLRALQSDSRTDVGHRLEKVIVTKRDDTGRAEFITLEGDHRKIVRGWDFKIIVGRVLGWNLLKSSRFEVSRSGANFVFRGSGFGHGLGLCQEGAHVMAARGASYQRILEKYFPGTSVGRERETGRRGDAAKEDSPPRWKADLFMSSFSSFSPSPRSLVSPYATFNTPQPTRLVTISSEHFRVTYPADNERRDADRVLTILGSARADYLRRASAASISISGLPFLDIRVNDSTGTFTGRTGQPPWAAAATKGNRIETQPLAILKRRGVLPTTLKHEMAHVIINVISRDRAPRWLEEGFAIYLAGEGAMFSRYQRRGLLTGEELEKRLQRPSTQSDMRMLYAEAYLKVTEMVRNEGEASVWKRLAAN
ncbi:MAG TPA: SpoIID/LytB domain-containing protein [Pyrinomonadaceae bacterium]|nr:SpoIID/LytB domain-containing protein [Pyrinomonadaceae bacterium]